MLVGVFVAITSSFVPVVARRLGADSFMMALVTAAPFVGNLSAVAAAYYLHGRRKMPFMVGAWTVARALFLLVLFITTPVPFVLVVVVYWVIVSLPVPGYAEVMQKIYSNEYRGRAMSYVRVGMTACATLGTPLAGQLLDIVGYQYLLPLAAVFGIVSSLAFGRIQVEESVATEKRPASDIWRILVDDRRYRRFSLAFFVYGFGYLLPVALYPIFLVDELHLSYSEVGVLGLVYAAFWMGFYVVWGRTVDKRGAFWTVRTNVLLSAMLPLGFFLAQDARTLALAYVFNGITVAGIDLGWLNAIMRLSPKERLADYTAVHSGLTGVRGLIAPFLGIALLSIPGVGLRGVFLLSVAVIVAGWLMIRRVPSVD